MTDLAKGSIIGNYEILSELGRGGMGVVYKAHEQSLQRVVALKVLPPKLAASEDFVKRFLREARSAARLNHPNIVTTHAVGESDGHYYIAMEYVKGSSLIDLIRDQGQMDVRNALKIIGQVSQALLEAHRQNIIHRDIKPHNIMIDEMGRARVMDFGLAHIGDDSTKLTQTGALVGTPVYMSPEQCRGEKLGPESDLFALGVTLYEMLAGRVPYSGDSPLAIMHQIVNEPVKPVTEYNSRIPDSVIDLLKKMMDRDRKTRYQDMMALAADVKKILKSDSLLNFSPETDPTLILKTKDETNTPEPESNNSDKQKSVKEIKPQKNSIKNPTEQINIDDLEWETFLRLKRWSPFAIIIMILIACTIALWQNQPAYKSSTRLPKTLPNAPPNEVWIDLMKNNSLDAWHSPGTPGYLGEWNITDGILSNHSELLVNLPTKNTDLLTKKEYKDFELKLEYKLTAKSNSGISLRGRVEIQLAGKDHPNSRKPKTANGSIFGLISPLVDPSHKPEEWNTMHIRYEGSEISANINGFTIHNEQVVVTGTKNKQPLKDPDNFKGPIILQSHTDKIWFRNIRIRPIKN